MTVMKRAVVIPVIMLCACASQDPEVAATVNGRPIPLENLWVAVAQSRPAAETDIDPSRVLEQMIERELLVQKAERLRIDRLPDVAREIAAARAGILARAYLSHTGTSYEQAPPALGELTLDRDHPDTARREARALRRTAKVEYFVEFGCQPEPAAHAGADAARSSPFGG